MSQNATEFREELRWNSYFVDGVYSSIEEEVQLAAEQFEAETDTEVPDEVLNEIIEDIVDNGLNTLTDDSDTS